MKIEGKEDELRKHFRKIERRQKSKPLKPEARRMIFIIVGVVVGLLLIFLTVQMIMDWLEYTSPAECDAKIKQAVLESKADGFWQTMIAKNAYVFPLLLIAMGIGWAIHGVGFRIF